MSPTKKHIIKTIFGPEYVTTPSAEEHPGDSDITPTAVPVDVKDTANGMGLKAAPSTEDPSSRPRPWIAIAILVALMLLGLPVVLWAVFAGSDSPSETATGPAAEAPAPDPGAAPAQEPGGDGAPGQPAVQPPAQPGDGGAGVVPPGNIWMERADGVVTYTGADGATLNAELVPGSAPGVSVTVDPAAQTATVEFDVTYTWQVATKLRPEENATATARASATFPLEPASATPPEGFPGTDPEDWAPPKGSWQFGASTPVQATIAGTRVVSIATFDDGREEVQKADVEDAATLDSSIAGIVAPRGRGWDVTVRVHHQGDLVPGWYLTLNAAGYAEVGDLESP